MSTTLGSRRPLKVFLCHASDDKARVGDLCRRLHSDGFEPWLDDEQLLPGQDWDLEIRRAVYESDLVIVCLSPTAISKSGYINKELKYALDVAEEKPRGRAFIIPVKLCECAVPEDLQQWQWADLLDAGGYERLSRSLRVQAEVLQLVAESAHRLAQAPGDSKPDGQKDERERVFAGGMFTSLQANTLRELARLMDERDSPPIGNATVPQWLAEQNFTEGLSMLPLPDNAMLLSATLQLQLPRISRDANASEWASIKTLPRYDSLDGFWSSRWRRDRFEPGDSSWNEGTAILKSSGDWVYIEYQDATNLYVIRARKVAANRLVGRFVNCGSTADTSAWVGLVVDNRRIDGFWSFYGRRWDFRR